MAHVIAETRQPIPGGLPPTPNPATANDPYLKSDSTIELTIRTKSGGVYTVEVPAETKVAVGDAWPPD